MLKKLLKKLKWIVGITVLWLAYLLFTIMNYPVGSLADSADAAIVLGAAVNKDQPSPVFTERLNHAINLYQAGKVKKLIFTGGIGEHQTHAEAMVARDFAIKKGVNSQDIFIETSSLTTKQNLVNAKQILDRAKLGSALIVSDSLHLKRALFMAKYLKINAKASATPSSRYQSFKKKLPFALRELYFYHHFLLFSE